MYFIKTKKEKFLKALENNDFNNIKKYGVDSEIDIVENFSFYLEESKKSENENFLLNFLSLFLESDSSNLIIDSFSLEHLNNHLSFLQKEKKYNILEKILEKNYIIAILNLHFPLNKGLICYFTDINDYFGFELALKHTKQEGIFIEVIYYVLKENHKFLIYLFKKHENLINLSLEKKPEINNHNLFKVYLKQKNIDKF